MRSLGGGFTSAAPGRRVLTPSFGQRPPPREVFGRMSDDQDRGSPPRPRLPPRPGPGFQGLLQGRDSWWHFLEAKSRGDLDPELGQDEDVELELAEVGRIAQRRQREHSRRFQPHHTRGLRCDGCGAQVPADLTFCVYCGAPPRFGGGMRGQVLVVDEIEDPDILGELADLLGASNDALSARELRLALSQPPAVFYLRARDEHAEALVDRLGELGVRASIRSDRDDDVPMTQEIAEAVVRDRRALAMWAALIAIHAALAVLLGWFALALLVASMAAFGYMQWRAYQVRYELDAERILNALTGMDAAMIQRARRGLESIEDEQVRELLTVCLMEYYAIWRQLQAAPPSMRRLLGQVKLNLDDLLEHLLEACQRYAELDHFLRAHPPEELQARVEALDARLLQAPDARTRDLISRELEQRHRQLRTASEIAEALGPMAQRLDAMCASMEALRARLVSMTLTRSASAHEEALIDEIMLDLDSEVGIFEQTLAEISIQAR